MKPETLDCSILCTLRFIGDRWPGMDLEGLRRLLYKYWGKGLPVGRMEMLVVAEGKRDVKSFERACRELI